MDFLWPLPWLKWNSCQSIIHQLVLSSSLVFCNPLSLFLTFFTFSLVVFSPPPWLSPSFLPLFRSFPSLSAPFATVSSPFHDFFFLLVPPFSFIVSHVFSVCVYIHYFLFSFSVSALDSVSAYLFFFLFFSLSSFSSSPSSLIVFLFPHLSFFLLKVSSCVVFLVLFFSFVFVTLCLLLLFRFHVFFFHLFSNFQFVHFIVFCFVTCSGAPLCMELKAQHLSLKTRLLVAHPFSTEPLARTLWHLDLRRGAWDQLVVSGTVGTTDGMVCGILGTEAVDAHGADPRTGDFLECFSRLVKLHGAQAGRDADSYKRWKQWLKRSGVNSELGLQSNSEGAGEPFRSA